MKLVASNKDFIERNVRSIKEEITNEAEDRTSETDAQ